MPDGFAQRQYATGLTNPTAMAFAPDSCPASGPSVHRLFVCQQGGAVNVYRDGLLQSTPFLTVAVDDRGERGLDGICFDPNFTTNGYVYVYYTIYQPDLSLPTHNRLSRFTADPANPDVALAGSETPIMEMDDLSTTALAHNGGGLHFGPDGKLYISVGENTIGSNSQSFDTVLGKILRINPIPEAGDGTNPDSTFPTDNPFYTSTTGKNRAIYILGVRHPFTFAFQADTGRLFLNDVGSYIWEEVDEGVKGGNYGWPTYEGPVEPPPVGFINPIYAYMHFSGGPMGCAITGGDFYHPVSLCSGDQVLGFPDSYLGQYFFIDFCSDWIYMMDPSQIDPASPYGFHTISLFASETQGSPTYLITGPDASLYYISRDDGAVYQIYYTASLVPSIGTQPADQLVGQGNPVTFTVAASGAPILHYQWQRDSVDIPGAADSPTYTLLNPQVSTDNQASIRCVVTNQYGSATSESAVLTVIPQQPPITAITAPASNSYYTDGDTISFAGSATDPQDGVLPPSALTWTILFEHHALSNPEHHTHPFFGPTSGIAGGTVTLNFGETDPDVWYHIILTAVDSYGLSTTVAEDIFPRHPLPQMLNSSTRGYVHSTDKPTIGGFIISGTDDKKTLVRAIGPSLANSGVLGALPDPTLQLFDSTGVVIAQNDNWKDTQEGDIEGTGIPPTDDLESAILATLPPSSYTAVVTGSNGAAGVGLVEIYDLPQSEIAELANLSSRSLVGTEDRIIIGGFILGNGVAGATPIVVRAIGPSLADKGVLATLQDPTLELHDGNGLLLASNDNWRDTQETVLEASGLAPTDDRESAISVSLPAGAYTAVVQGKNGATGVALFEVYNLDQPQ
ncbi:MAG: PQQ-dependent sugar dehydrogenase [Chthoniobacterales bacterium]